MIQEKAKKRHFYGRGSKKPSTSIFRRAVRDLLASLLLTDLSSVPWTVGEAS
jgi:hypothetical protein